jgi:hypothetical protein
MHLKFAKSAFMPQKQIFHQISIWKPKKTEFNADFKFGVVMLKNAFKNDTHIELFEKKCFV